MFNLWATKSNLKLTSKSSYMLQKIFYDNYFVVILKNKVTLTLNKPAYVRMCILDLSEVLLNKFHYDFITKKYGNSSWLLFTGMDSLMYEIKTEDVFEDFNEVKKMFDFSNYSAES